jgi:hypothetical protein
MLTKPLNRTHALAGISEDPRAEMSDPWTNSPEHLDGPTFLDIDRRIWPLLGARDLGAKMSGPWANYPEHPGEPMILGDGRGLDKNTSNPTSWHGKLLHLNVRSICQKPRELHAHKLVPPQKIINKWSLGDLADRHYRSMQGKWWEWGNKMNMTTIGQTSFLDNKLFDIYMGREES